MSRFVHPATLRALQGLPLVARTLADSLTQGLHPSRRRGVVGELAGHRTYEPGDDLRRLDWKLYARTDRYYVREAEQEAAHQLFFILDASGSMAYAEHGLSKLEYASYLIATLALLLYRQGDALALGLVQQGKSTYLPPLQGRNALNKLWATLEEASPTGTWPAASALPPRLPGRSLVLWFTDLYSVGDEVLEHILASHSTLQDTTVFQVLGKQEMEFNFKGAHRFEDLETGAVVELDAGAARQAYLASFEAYRQVCQLKLQQRGIATVTCRLDEPLEQPLLSWLKNNKLPLGR